MKARLRALVAVVAALCLSTPVAAAEARFVVNRSMEGVAIGMSAERVRDRLGDPARREAGPDFESWIYRRPSMEVTLKPDVITLYTRSADIRGPGGVGVRTRERRLRAVLGRRLRCETSGGQRHCVVGSFETGRRSTVFEMVRRRVKTITISVSTQ